MSNAIKKTRPNVADRLRRMYAEDPDFDQAAEMMSKLNSSDDEKAPASKIFISEVIDLQANNENNKKIKDSKSTSDHEENDKDRTSIPIENSSSFSTVNDSRRQSPTVINDSHRQSPTVNKDYPISTVDDSQKQQSLSTVADSHFQQSPSTVADSHLQQSIANIYKPKNTLEKIIKTLTRKTIWNYLKALGDHPTKVEHIAKYTNISYGTVRDILRVFEKAGLIKKERWRGYGNDQQGMTIKILVSEYGDVYNIQLSTVANSQIQQSIPTVGDSHYQRSRSTVNDSQNISSIDRKIDSNSFKENLSIYNEHVEKLKALTDEDIAFFYPSLAAIDFKTQQIEQIIDRLIKIDKSPERVLIAMEHIEFELSNGVIKDASGKKPENVLNYVFMCLARTGYYRKPKGFLSEKEIALQDEADRLESEKRAEAKVRELQYEHWKKSLNKDKKNEIEEELKNKNKGFLGPEDSWLKDYWNKNISE